MKRILVFLIILLLFAQPVQAEWDLQARLPSCTFTVGTMDYSMSIYSNNFPYLVEYDKSNVSLTVRVIEDQRQLQRNVSIGGWINCGNISRGSFSGNPSVSLIKLSNGSEETEFSWTESFTVPQGIRFCRAGARIYGLDSIGINGSECEGTSCPCFIDRLSSKWYVADSNTILTISEHTAIKSVDLGSKAELWGKAGVLIALLALTINALQYHNQREKSRKDNALLSADISKINYRPEKKSIQVHFNIHNKGNRSTTVDKIHILFNKKTPENDSILYETVDYFVDNTDFAISNGTNRIPKDILEIPFDMEPNKTKSLMIEVDNLPETTNNKKINIELDVRHTHGNLRVEEYHNST